jgi:glycosyltransferase involved in cell wall biosynthesis
MAARIAGLSYSFTAHAKDIYASDVDRVGLELKFRDCAFAVTVCRANERFLHENVRSSRGKVLCLYNGIDLERLAGDSRAPSSEGPMTRPVDVLAVGRFVEKKGFGLLLQAIARLKAEGKAVRCRILGDGELLPVIRSERIRLGLESEVEIPGAASSEQVRDAMRTATVLACPCIVAENGDQDALPTVLLEALALGLPTIATPVGGIDEILDGGNAGLLVEPSIESLAAGLDALLHDPEKRHQLREAGRARAASLFDIRRNVETLAKTFHSHAARTQ